MSNFAGAFIIVGIIIMAVALIILAIWTANLSNKVKKLSGLVQMQRDDSADRQALMRDHKPNLVRPETPRHEVARQDTGQNRPIQPAPQPPRDPYQNQQNAQLTPEYDTFFREYQQNNDPGQTSPFRRPAPTIPYGRDTNAVERRNGYTMDAISQDFDPDSIDFSRVLGYRRNHQ